MAPYRIARRIIPLALAAALGTTSALAQSKDAEPATQKTNSDLVATLPLADSAAFDDARRGLIATLPDDTIAGAGPQPAYSLKPYSFLDKTDPPPTVNPSLWRQARLNL